MGYCNALQGNHLVVQAPFEAMWQFQAFTTSYWNLLETSQVCFVTWFWSRPLEDPQLFRIHCLFWPGKMEPIWIALIWIIRSRTFVACLEAWQCHLFLKIIQTKDIAGENWSHGHVSPLVIKRGWLENPPSMISWENEARVSEPVPRSEQISTLRGSIRGWSEPFSPNNHNIPTWIRVLGFMVLKINPPKHQVVEVSSAARLLPAKSKTVPSGITTSS